MLLVRLASPTDRNVIEYEIGDRSRFKALHRDDPTWVFLDRSKFPTAQKIRDFKEKPFKYTITKRKTAVNQYRGSFKTKQPLKQLSLSNAVLPMNSALGSMIGIIQESTPDTVLEIVGEGKKIARVENGRVYVNSNNIQADAPSNGRLLIKECMLGAREYSRVSEIEIELIISEDPIELDMSFDFSSAENLVLLVTTL